MQGGHVAEACRKFAESVSLLRRGGALLNLAVCREAEGRNATALRLLEEAREFAMRDGRADRVALAEERIQDVRSRLSWLTIRPSLGASQLELAIACDGEAILGATWGAPRAVDPGPHTVVATAPGRIPFQATVVVGPAGDQETVEVPPLLVDRSADFSQASPRAFDVTAPSARAMAGWSAPLGWTAIGVGAAAAAVGATFGLESVADNSESKAQCLSTNVCTAAGYQKNQAARTEAIVADVAIPAGVVAAGVGLYLLLASRWVAAPSPKAATGSANRSSEVDVGFRLTGLIPSVAPGMAQISAWSTW